MFNCMMCSITNRSLIVWEICRLWPHTYQYCSMGDYVYGHELLALAPNM